jgi:hypothetical protein
MLHRAIGFFSFISFHIYNLFKYFLVCSIDLLCNTHPRSGRGHRFHLLLKTHREASLTQQPCRAVGSNLRRTETNQRSSLPPTAGLFSCPTMHSSDVVFSVFSCFVINEPCATLVMHHRQAIFSFVSSDNGTWPPETLNYSNFAVPAVNWEKSIVGPVLIWRLTEGQWNDNVTLFVPLAKVYKLTQSDHRALWSFPNIVVRMFTSTLLFPYHCCPVSSLSPWVEYFRKTYHLRTKI